MKKPFLIDTHCHVHLIEDDKIKSSIINEMTQNNIQAICVGTNLQNSIEAIKFCKNNNSLFFPAIGIHPCDVKQYYENKQLVFEELENLIINNKIYAIGETGIDLYHNKDLNDLEQQKSFFIKHIEIAIKYDLPVIVHVRESDDEVINIIKNFSYFKKFLIHCFSAKLDKAKVYVDMGCHISFAGKITYPNDLYLMDVAKNIELNNIFAETDSPWLSPIPFKGQKNNPNKVIYIYQKIAEAKNESFEKISKIMVENSLNFFKIN